MTKRIPDVAIERWIRETPTADVYAAIDRVEWVSATKTRAKNAAHRFVNENPNDRPLAHMRDVGGSVLTILRLAMDHTFDVCEHCNGAGVRAKGLT